jgi:hypothetical protein
MFRQGKLRHSKERLGKEGQRKARQGMARQDKAGVARQDKARRV